MHDNSKAHPATSVKAHPSPYSRISSHQIRISNPSILRLLPLLIGNLSLYFRDHMAFLQIGGAFIVGFLFYITTVLMTSFDGVLTVFTGAFSATILTLASMLILNFIGLPLRIYTPLKVLWRAHWWIPPVIAAFAMFLSVLSWAPGFQVTAYDPDLDTSFQSCDPGLWLSSYLLFIFAALHFHPPLHRLSSSLEQSN